MTPRERLWCVLEGGTPDRVPVSPFVQEEYLSYFFGKGGMDRLVDAVRCAEELDFDLVTKQNVQRVPHFMTESGPNWNPTVSTRISDGVYWRRTVIQTPTRELAHTEAAPSNEKVLPGVHTSTIEYLIKDKADFEAFAAYVPRMGEETIGAVIEAGRFSRNYIGERGLTCPWAIGGVFNLASTYISIEDILVDALVNEEYYCEYMAEFARLAAENYDVYGASEFDCVGIQGNIANGSIMGEGFFRAHVMPFEIQALSALRGSGKPTIYHNCGCAKNLYSCYRDMGITVWETVAAPPQGDNSLADAKRFFGNTLVLSGNLDQVDFLKTASPKIVRDAAVATVEAGKAGGHYIFAASDYLEIGTPIGNVKAMLEGAKHAGRY